MVRIRKVLMLTVMKSSLVWSNGYPPGYASVVVAQQTFLKQEGTYWGTDSNEYGKSVSLRYLTIQ